MLWGGELVLRDGVAAGQVTSAAWGATLGRCAGLAYLWDPDGGPIDARWIGEGSYQVNVGGDVYPVAVTTQAPYDPAGHKFRA
jgi:glycine cleavage system aminomethyltransferase T